MFMYIHGWFKLYITCSIDVGEKFSSRGYGIAFIINYIHVYMYAYVCVYNIIFFYHLTSIRRGKAGIIVAVISFCKLHGCHCT